MSLDPKAEWFIDSVVAVLPFRWENRFRAGSIGKPGKFRDIPFILEMEEEILDIISYFYGLRNAVRRASFHLDLFLHGENMDKGNPDRIRTAKELLDKTFLRGGGREGSTEEPEGIDS